MEIRDLVGELESTILPSHLSDQTVSFYQWKVRFFAAYDWLDKKVIDDRFDVRLWLCVIPAIGAVRWVASSFLPKHHSSMKLFGSCARIIEKSYVGLSLAAFTILGTGCVVKKTTAQSETEYKNYLTALVTALIAQKEHMKAVRAIKGIERMLDFNSHYDPQQKTAIKQFIRSLVDLLIKDCEKQHKDECILLILSINHPEELLRDMYAGEYQRLFKEPKQKINDFWKQESTKVPNFLSVYE